jgi:hypothetical protein
MEGKKMHSMSNIKRIDQVGLSLEMPSALRHIVRAALLDQR